MTWISFNVLFHYVCALSVDPNTSSPDEWEGLTNVARVCASCCKTRPLRARHCYLCGRCVQKIDHHCPWINNCVGHANHRYFMLFLVYLLLGTALCGLQITQLKGLMRLSLGWAVFGQRQETTLTAGGGQFGIGALTSDRDAARYGQATETSRALFTNAQVRAMDHTVVMFVQVLCLAIFIAMIGFVGWCGSLLLTNQTAYEFAPNQAERERWVRRWGGGRRVTAAVVPYRSPYDLGRLHNLLQVFATANDSITKHALRHASSIHGLRKVAVVLWATLPSLEPLAMDGLEWPRWDGGTLRTSQSAVDDDWLSSVV